MEKTTTELLLIQRLARNQTQMPLITELKDTLVSSGLYKDSSAFFAELRSTLLSQINYKIDKENLTKEQAIEEIVGNINTKELTQNLINNGINKQIFAINFEHESGGGYHTNFSDTRNSETNRQGNFNVNTDAPTLTLARAINKLKENDLTSSFVDSFINNQDKNLVSLPFYNKIKEDVFIKMETLKMSDKLGKLSNLRNKLSSKNKV